MREGLLFLGAMAAVVATTAIVNAASPAPTALERNPNNPVQFPSDQTPAKPPANDTPPVAPVLPDEVPVAPSLIPSPANTAPPRRPPVNPAPPSVSLPPPPIDVPITPPPPTSNPCPIGLELNPILGICVVI